MICFFQFMKVQDPDNSSQTVYDAWVKSNASRKVSCNMTYTVSTPLSHTVYSTDCCQTLGSSARKMKPAASGTFHF